MSGSKKESYEIDYVKDEIPSIYRRLLPSAIGSLLTATVASLIDVVILSYFLGPEMLAVVEICMPVYMLVNTIGMLIASGASTLYAECLGEGNKEEALHFFTASVWHILIFGGLLSGIGLLFTRPVIHLLGANEVIFASTLDYANVLFFFMIPLMIYVHLLFFIRVDNDPNRVLAATISCAVVNLILDVLFVGPMHLGPKGAAMATCIAYTVGMIVNLTHFFSKKNSLKLLKGSLSGRGVRMWRTGLPLAASQFGMTISTNIFNNTIMRVGNQDYVSVYAVITQLSMTSMAIYDGIGQASQPIIAAGTGAGDKKRVHNCLRHGIILELAGTCALSLIYILLAGPIAGLFSIKEGELLALSLTGIRIYALSIPFIGLNSIIMYFFQAQEKTGRALVISLLSGSVLLVISLFFLILCFGERGIWFSWVVAQIVALVVSVCLFKSSRNKEGGL